MRAWGGIATATALALALCLVDIGDKQLHIDESFSYSLTQLPFDRFIETLTRSEANMALHFLLLRVWTALGTSEAVLRLLSLIFGVATVPVVGALGLRLFGPTAGVASALALAVNTDLVVNAQYARGYTMVLFFVCLSTYLLFRAAESDSPWRWVAYVAAAVAAFYSHLFAGWVLLIHGVSMRWIVPGSRRRAAALALGSIALFCAPLVLWAVLRGPGQVAWLPRLSLWHVGSQLLALAGGSRPVGALYLVAIAIWMVWSWRDARRAGEPGPDERARVLVFLWLVVPAALSLTISFWSMVFHGRYLIVSLPAVALIAGDLFSRLPHRPARSLLAAAFLLLSIWGTRTEWYQLPSEPPRIRRATTHVLEHARPGDGLLVLGDYLGRAFDYYSDRIDPPAREGLERVDEGNASAVPRVWVVYTSATPDPTAWGLPTLEERRTYEYVTVELRRPGGGG